MTAHFPLYLGIVIAGVGVQRIVTAASRARLTTAESTILVGAMTAVMLAMTTIGATSAGRRRPTSFGVMQNVGLAVATLAIGIVGHFESPLVLILLIVTLYLAQLGVVLNRRSSAASLARA